MPTFFEELKRRNVIKAAIAYAVVTWVLLQVLSLILPNVGAPEWVMKTITILAIVGFPIWVFFSWVYEVTPEGLKKTENVESNHSISQTTNKRLNILIIIGLIAAIGVMLLQPNSGYISSLNNDEYSIAVLPFDDLSSGKDTEWFCDGVTEDILTYLSKVEGLKVISRTSVMQYKDRKKTIPEIAKELGVSFLVEGSVRKHGNDVRITAQLIAANDEHLWADNYSGTMDDVFKLQGDVSQQIAQQLKIKISPEVKKNMETYPTENIEAYQAVLRGRSYMDKFDTESAKIAKEFFEKAVKLDPNYADAYADLALATMAAEGSKDSLLVVNYIDKALKLNPNSSRVNSIKGIILNFVSEKPEKAIDFLEKAIEINPNDERAHGMMAAYYMNLQEDSRNENLDKSLHHINQAISLDPFSVQSKAIKLMVLARRNEVDKAEALFHDNFNDFSNENKSNAARIIINKKIQLETKENQSSELKIYQYAIKKYPFEAAYFTQRLAAAYDGIFNDQDAYLKYAKRAYEMDSSQAIVVSQYQAALLESGLLDEAEKLQNSENYKNVVSKSEQAVDLFNFYYFKKDRQNLEKILGDSIMHTRYALKAYSYSQFGDIDKLNSVKDKLNNISKAIVFAILKQRDSMYHYLHKDDISDRGAQYPNSRPEMDPYRNESRYIEFLKKHHFPVSEQKN